MQLKRLVLKHWQIIYRKNMVFRALLLKPIILGNFYILIYFYHITVAMQPPLIDPSVEIEISKALHLVDPTAIKSLLDEGHIDPNTIVSRRTEWRNGILINRPLNLLQYAAEYFSFNDKASNYKVIAALIKRGAHANHEQDFPVLHSVSHYNNYYGVLTLLCASYNPNQQTSAHYTPLLYASRNGYETDHWATIKFLLAAGAGASLKVQCVPDPDERQLKNVYEYARYWKNEEAIRLFKIEEQKLDEYESLKNSLDCMRQQKDTFLSYLPQELLLMLFKFMPPPPYELDFTIPDDVLDSIKEELGLEQLPLWTQKARQGKHIKGEQMNYFSIFSINEPADFQPTMLPTVRD